MKEDIKKVTRRRVNLPSYHTLGMYEYYVGQVINAMVAKSGPDISMEYAFRHADNWARFLVAKSGREV